MKGCYASDSTSRRGSSLLRRIQALQASHDKASRAARKKAFEAEFGDWIAAQNAHYPKHGIPGADLRPW